MVQIKCLSNGLYSLKNSHIPFGMGFQQPPPLRRNSVWTALFFGWASLVYVRTRIRKGAFGQNNVIFPFERKCTYWQTAVTSLLNVYISFITSRFWVGPIDVGWAVGHLLPPKIAFYPNHLFIPHWLHSAFYPCPPTKAAYIIYASILAFC